MAIKFRCRHCRQFLGISLARAGQVVDCPTCGRTIRVPDLDGRIRPLPSPQLDLEDSALVKALGEVAKIGKPPSTESMDVRSDVEPAEAREVIEPVPLPEPEPLDPPMPIEIAPAPRAVLVDKVTDDLPEQSTAERDFISELAQLAGEATVVGRRRSARDDGVKRLIKQLLATTVLITVLVAALLSFGLGLWAGRTTSPEPARNPIAKANDAANAGGNAVVPNVNRPSTASVRGRITFKSQSGDSSPDVGAKVIVFPIKADGGAKLAVAGFRATATEAEIQSARDALRTLGGDLAVANNDGEFEIRLPGPGTYPALVLSHSQRRDADNAVDTTLKQFLESRLDQPDSLPGDVRHNFSRIRYRGTGPEVWDYSFEGE